MLIISSAIECGFTPQYNELQDLYEKYRAQGFEILDFPCDQFEHQAPGTNEEIYNFCSLNFGIEFPIFSKIDVNGENAIPLFKYLVKEKGFQGFDQEHKMASAMDDLLSKISPNYKNEPDIKWNFTKFLIDRQGNIVQRYEPTADIKKIEEKISGIL